MTSPPHSTAARSMTWSSSRTLPGQPYASRRAIASSETARAGVPRSACATSSGMSLRRARSGGTSISMTASR